MDMATIGDDIRPLYEFDWGEESRTTDEPWMKAALDGAEHASLDDIVDEARDDPECEVTLLGFEGQ